MKNIIHILTIVLVSYSNVIVASSKNSFKKALIDDKIIKAKIVTYANPIFLMSELGTLNSYLQNTQDIIRTNNVITEREYSLIDASFVSYANDNLFETEIDSATIQNGSSSAYFINYSDSKLFDAELGLLKNSLTPIDDKIKSDNSVIENQMPNIKGGVIINQVNNSNHIINSTVKF